MLPQRHAFWEMYPDTFGWSRMFVYLVAAFVMAIFAYGVVRRIQTLRTGKPTTDNRFDRPWERIKGVLLYWLGQAKVLKETYPGLMHVLIFFGFIVLFIGTATTVFDEDFNVWLLGREKFITGGFYEIFSFFLDAFGVLALLGILIALYRRYVQKPSRLDLKGEDAFALSLIGLILVTGFIVEALRIAITSPDFEVWSTAGYGLAALFGKLGIAGDAAKTPHQVFWFVHFALAMVFVGSLPFYNRLWHIFGSAMNIYTRNLDAKGNVPNIPNMMARMENGEEVEMGYKRLDQFTWKELLDLDACTRCGRCQDQCPANATDKPLSPKKVIQDLKTLWDSKVAAVRDANVDDDKKAVDAGGLLLKAEDEEKGAIATDVLWACTNCMACMNACPVMIEHIPLINNMRRELAMEFEAMDKECKTLFKNMDTNANPWGMNPADRNGWIIDGLEVPTIFEKPDAEYLLWVSCLGGFDPRSQRILQSFVKILNAAKVSFATMGEMELCCGDSLRRLGNEASFQAIVQMNLDNLKESGAKMTKVLTICPHCYNTLKHEYPTFGAQWEVTHHSVFIDQLMREGKIKLQPGESIKATLHDSCFLGRYNSIYDEPRQVAQACGATLVEAEKSRDTGFCCGGGGGRLWLEEHGQRINATRVKQLVDTGADAILSACPYCMMKFDEGTKLGGFDEKVKLYDIAELAAQKLVTG